MFFGNPKHRNISKPIWTLHVLSSRKATSYVILKTTNIIRIETLVLALVRHWNDARDRYFRIVFFRICLLTFAGDLNSSLKFDWWLSECSTMSSKRNDSIVLKITEKFIVDLLRQLICVWYLEFSLEIVKLLQVKVNNERRAQKINSITILQSTEASALAAAATHNNNNTNNYMSCNGSVMAKEYLTWHLLNWKKTIYQTEAFDGYSNANKQFNKHRHCIVMHKLQ